MSSQHVYPGTGVPYVTAFPPRTQHIAPKPGHLEDEQYAISAGAPLDGRPDVATAGYYQYQGSSPSGQGAMSLYSQASFAQSTVALDQTFTTHQAYAQSTPASSPVVPQGPYMSQPAPMLITSPDYYGASTTAIPDSLNEEINQLMLLAYPTGDTRVVSTTQFQVQPSITSFQRTQPLRDRAMSDASSVYSGTVTDDDTFSVRSGASTPPSSVHSSAKSVSSLAVNDSSSCQAALQARTVASAAIRGASEARRHPRNREAVRFYCDVPGCGSDFTTKSNLQGHMRSHNGEKPYICRAGCGRGFARQSDMHRHEEKLHPDVTIVKAPRRRKNASPDLQAAQARPSKHGDKRLTQTPGLLGANGFADVYPQVSWFAGGIGGGIGVGGHSL